MATAKLYVAGALGAVILALAIGLLLYRGQAISARAEQAKLQVNLDTALAVNTANEATIQRLTKYREIDDNLMVNLQGRLQDLATQTAAANEAVKELEKTNEVVAEYLRASLPDELKRLLAPSGKGTDTSP